MLTGCRVIYPNYLSTRPPDPELVDLIEQAFLERQISGWEADLAYLHLLAKFNDLRRVARI